MKKKQLGPTTNMFPKPTVLVGTMVNGKPNFMTASWTGIACLTPPALSVAIRPIRYTHQGVVEQQKFSINIPSTALAKKTDYCGVFSGADRDKSELFRIFYGKLSDVPLVEECPINFECKVIKHLDIGTHTLFIGEIMETHASEDCLSNGKPDIMKVDPIIYATGTRQYHKVGTDIGRAYEIGID